MNNNNMVGNGTKSAVVIKDGDSISTVEVKMSRSGAANGASIGATIGARLGPYGIIGGVIIGGVLGAIVGESSD